VKAEIRFIEIGLTDLSNLLSIFVQVRFNAFCLNQFALLNIEHTDFLHLHLDMAFVKNYLLPDQQRNSKTKCFFRLPANSRRYMKCKNCSDSPHMI